MLAILHKDWRELKCSMSIDVAFYFRGKHLLNNICDNKYGMQ